MEAGGKESPKSRAINTESALVLHDYFAIKGGGERLALTLAAGLGCPLHTAFWGENAYDQRDWPGVDIKAFSSPSATPALQMLRLISGWQRYKATGDWSTAIYSGSYAPLAVNGINAGRHVMYCHSPPRFLYDQRDFFLNQLRPWQRPFFKCFMAYFKPRYEAAVEKMDVIIANSENVRQRIKKYLGRDSVVVHPPCDVESFKWLGQGDYYLSTARLDPLKRVDLIVEAFCRMPDKRLVVASGGPELPYLKHLANGCPNVTFTDWVDEAKLHELIGNAIATIYIPHDEDFGMSPVESMAAGKPVIGVAEGGLCETVIDGVTGLFLDHPVSIEGVGAAVYDITPVKANMMRMDCEERARVFCVDMFLQKVKNALPRG